MSKQMALFAAAEMRQTLKQFVRERLRGFELRQQARAERRARRGQKVAGGGGWLIAVPAF